VRSALSVTRAAAVLLVLATGCSGSRAQVEKRLPDPPSPTTAVEQTYDVPAVIDAAYVNRVLAALDALDGDIFRIYLRDRAISPAVAERIRALYGGSAEKYDREVRSLEDEKDYRPAQEPGNRISKVTRLITATPACIYAQVERDFRPVMGTVHGQVEWVGLQPISALANQGKHNPTPWMYVVNGFMPDRSQPPNPCAGS
jgi:hypothetical protein